ncbi:hypothetical protein SAMN06264364_1583 [Quadrisphaera granulorum]|uniref:Uncharacterized protein n=1 Tax=Quadrisphaera granulorum TaxID=317664 RepID=A0A315ZI13_9ACTN|nr:hypothetical protein [Quadrisphaera granulorum]PWJ45161.1 hypothetical protein BXY45_1583 [Quadrisphaera granulorum]SZE99185.1 hypothetical protein SAMN06264364_1583 [Quadrisphaera granulorum]
MERHTVDERKVARSAASSTKASAKLEDRILPPDFVRSPRITELLDKRRRSS